MPSNTIFRAGVGAIIVNGKGEVLACHRATKTDDVGVGTWQMPQGGLDGDEDPIVAVLREIKEETGISPELLEIYGQYPHPLSYEIPKESRLFVRGQTQYWFLLRFSGTDEDIDVEPGGEFDRWKWMTLHSLSREAWEGKRHIYEALALYFEPLLAK